MELVDNENFLAWARQHMIEPHPKYPSILAYVPELGDSRFWPIPIDSRAGLAMLTICLDTLDPWQSCWAFKRASGWSFACADTTDADDQGLDVITRWIGIPEDYAGSVRFDDSDRAKLVLLLMVFNEYGWNINYDVFFVPDHGQQFLWLDHEDALWVFFSDSERIEPFVTRMEAAGFPLPTEPPSPISWQHWMGPKPEGWLPEHQREAHQEETNLKENQPAKRDFDLWLEFEHWVPDGSEDPECDFFNALVTLPGGKKYALNIWTFKYLEVARRECEESGEHLSGKYLLPPDLFVTLLDRSHVEEIIADLIANGGLKEEWFVLDVDHAGDFNVPNVP